MPTTVLPLAVSTLSTPQGLVVEVAGEVDLNTVPLLQPPLLAAVDETLASPDHTRLTVDMRQVEFIDSAGLALLVTLRKRLSPASRALHILLTPDSQPDRVLMLGKFDTIMTLAYPAG